MLGDARENVGEPGLRIDVIHLGGLCRPPNYAECARFPQYLWWPAYDRLGIVCPVPPLSTAENRMMIAEAYLSRSRLFRRLKSGPHGQLIELYAARLVKDGLARHGTWRCLNVASGLVSWIASSRSKLTDLDERIIERYLRHRAGKQSIQPGDQAALRRLLSVLRDVGTIRPASSRRSPRRTRYSRSSAIICEVNAVWRRSPSSATCRSSAGSCVSCARPTPATSARSARRTSPATSSATPEIGVRRRGKRCAGRCAHFSDTSIIEG